MKNPTVKLSRGGRLVIPKEIRERLHWDIGIELTLSATPDGVTLTEKGPTGQQKLVDLIGLLQHDGPPVPLAKLCKPVELAGAEWKENPRDRD